MYVRNAYNKTIWVPVPEPTNPPVDAEALVSENLNNIEEGIGGTRSSLHSAIMPLNDNEFLPIDPIDSYPDAMILGKSVLTDFWGFDGFVTTYKPNNTTGIQVLFPTNGGMKIRRSQAPSRPVWQPSTFYNVGQEVQPTTGNGYYFVCSVSGTSGSVEPAWNTTASTLDGSATWDVGSEFWYAWENYAPFIANQFVSYDNPATSGTRVSAPSHQILTSSLNSSTNTLLSDAEFIQLEVAEATTVNSAPTIAAGVNGQLLTLVNVGDFGITIQDNATLIGSTLHLSAATLTLAPRQNVKLIYLSSEGGWVQL